MNLTIHSTITPELAQAILRDAYYPNQRRLRPGWVEFLATEMRQGTFLTKDALEICVLLPEKVHPSLENSLLKHGQDVVARALLQFSIDYGIPIYLTNGQHRLTAIVKSGCTYVLPIQLLPVHSMREVADIYRYTDAGAGRKPADQYRALGLGNAYGLPEHKMNQTVAAASFIAGNFTAMGRSSHQEQRIQWLEEWGLYAHTYFEWTLGEGRVELERGACIALGMITIRYAMDTLGEEMVKEFWQGIAKDDGLRQNDPRKVALKFLKSTTHSKNAIDRDVVSPAHTVRILAHCWNAWVKGRELLLTRVIDHQGPFTILGTPYNKG